jgi:hypothetical protein
VVEVVCLQQQEVQVLEQMENKHPMLLELEIPLQ